MNKLLLHACCAPCSSGVVPQVDKYDVTLFFYNPNIDTIDEYNRRLQALVQYIESYNAEFGTNLKYIAVPYDHNEFLLKTHKLNLEKEGGKRCEICIGIRLKVTAEYAKKNGYDVFASTLSVSPHKNHKLINDIGDKLSEEYDIDYLQSDFKKNNGFLNSINNSKKYKLYRQNYCGCEFAKSHLDNKRI